MKRRKIVLEESLNEYELFWKNIKQKQKLTQLQKYELNNSPEYIKEFIKLGGGPKMGSICEQFAKHKFSCLKKRDNSEGKTGYDHLVEKNKKKLYIEQKSSGHWSTDDYKWQHIEPDHKWDILLLCGIDYTEIKFWIMNRKIFNELVLEEKICNQGNKTKQSSEGMWFNYSDVKDELIEVTNNDDLYDKLFYN